MQDRNSGPSRTAQQLFGLLEQHRSDPRERTIHELARLVLSLFRPPDRPPALGFVGAVSRPLR